MFKTCRFAHSGESHVAVGILLLYLPFSLSLSHFQPIFLSFIVISDVLFRCLGHVACRLVVGDVC